MKWWPRRRAPRASEEAEAALRQAERALIDAERLDCAARDVAERLKATRHRNHFAAAVIRATRRA